MGSLSQPDIEVHSGLECASLRYYCFLSTHSSSNLIPGSTVNLLFSLLLVLHLQLSTIATTSVTCTFRVCLNPDNYSQKTFTLAGLLSLFQQKKQDLCVAFCFTYCNLCWHLYLLLQSPMKGSRQYPLSYLSWWPYYLPLWILLLIPLTASSLNFLLLCLQASHNSFPSQADSCSFYPTPVSFCSDASAVLTSHSPSHPALSPWPGLQRASMVLLIASIHQKPQCFFPQRRKDLGFFCTSSCALTRGTSWLCSGHHALHSYAPAWHLHLAKVPGQPWGGDSLPLHSEVSKEHSGHVKGVLLINHGSSGIQMPGVILTLEYLVVPKAKLISPLSALSSGSGHYCQIWVVFPELEPFVSVMNGFPQPWSMLIVLYIL